MWFTESAWPPIIVLALFALVMGGLWLSQRRGIWLIAAAVALVGCFAVYYVEQAIVTESERIEQNVFDLTRAVCRKDEAKTLSYISKQAPELRDVAIRGMKLVDIREDLDIKDLSVRLLAENSQALSHFRANGTVSVKEFGGVGAYYPTRWEVRWQKEGGDWKIVEVVRLDPLKEERMGILEQKQ
jgi:hypothetical protein